MTHHTLFALTIASATSLLLLAACTSDEAGVSQRTSLEELNPTTWPTLREYETSPTADYRQTLVQKASTNDLNRPTSSAPVSEHARGSMLNPRNAIDPRYAAAQPASAERYVSAEDNPVMLTENASVSTFSIDVDTGSYSNIRRFIQQGSLPPPAAVRIEEMLNYFTYDYPTTAITEQPFSVVTELGASPWNSATQLLHIGLKGYTPPQSHTLPANLVFLIDVSGSMNSPDKLGLLTSSISLLANELDGNDIVSIVVYAGSSGVVLEPTAGREQKIINKALSQLSAGGSTHGSQGIELAYELASENFLENGINRVILATDGDFNVGISDTDQLKRLISQKRESGIALTTLGFGTGNYNDHLMEQLADTGNGSYAYIDTLSEARKVLVNERHSTMMSIASDVKIQIEFNPERISEYRLIGYSNRRLANKDFNNDKIDAGDIGAGHTVTALYEVALHGDDAEQNTPLRYRQAATRPASEFSDELAEIRLRYKLPGEHDSRLIKQIVRDTLLTEATQQASENFRFSASVAGLGQLLTSNDHINDFNYQDIRELALGSLGEDTFGYRAEFIRLVDMAESLHRMQQTSGIHKIRGEG